MLFREFLFQNNLPEILFSQSNDTTGSTIIRRCDWSLQSAQTIKKQGRKDRKRHVDAENSTFSCASKRSILKDFVQRVSHRWKRLNAMENTGAGLREKQARQCAKPENSHRYPLPGTHVHLCRKHTTGNPSHERFTWGGCPARTALKQPSTCNWRHHICFLYRLSHFIRENELNSDISLP
jgi:hypothetical protein